jgi:hypothetical protein
MARDFSSNVMITVLKDGVLVEIRSGNGFRPITLGDYKIDFINPETSEVLYHTELLGIDIYTSGYGWAKCVRKCGYRDVDIKVVVHHGSKKVFEKFVGKWR